MGKVKLNVLGISYSQTQSGAYALVLAEENGTRRIPIIVGGFEAQAIAIELEGLHPPRPLTHDLFKSFAVAYGIKLLEVNVHKLEEGVFYANVLFDNGDKVMTLDARTSDAIALAIRFKCPIYTTEAIVEKAGIVLDFDQIQQGESPEMEDDINEAEDRISEDIEAPKPVINPGFSRKTLEELNSMLEEAIKEEDYEKASLIRDEINKREK